MLLASSVGACAVLPGDVARPGDVSGPAARADAPELRHVVQLALALRGTRYRSGGHSPDTGFDCSGFVWYVFSQAGLQLPRSARDMAQSLHAVALRERSPGDLLFFDTQRAPHSHVGIYLGNDDFVHAPSRSTGRVMVSTLRDSYWAARVDGVRRPPLSWLP